MKSRGIGRKGDGGKDSYRPTQLRAKGAWGSTQQSHDVRQNTRMTEPWLEGGALSLPFVIRHRIAQTYWGTVAGRNGGEQS